MTDLVLTPTAPLESGRYPGFRPSIVEYDDFIKHTDVAVPLRDGTIIYVDLFHPKDGGKSAALVGWSPYGKHGLKSLAIMPGADVDPAWVSPYVIWEGPDPSYWCPRGYTIVSPDPRGAWSSEGTLSFWSRSEAQDGYDVVEWLASQDWSNGKVGMLGVSYLASSQWMIAATRPPSLAAICPWEGLSDVYREIFFHGGIPEKRFMDWWQPKSRFSLRPAEDVHVMVKQHPMFDDYWKTKEIALEDIEVPALVVASWSDHGMHTRGTIAGFDRIGSKEKWLEIHGQKKWRHFYHPESIARQTAFFDHFLQGRETGLRSWPKIRYELRETNAKSTSYAAEEWPLSDTEARRFHLDCKAGQLLGELPVTPGEAAFDTELGATLTFDFQVDEDFEIVGGGGLHLWLAADSHDEADVFIGVTKIDETGTEVGFRFYSTFDNGPLGLGWLRASHRKPAPGSTELHPLHSHDESWPLAAGVFVALDVEVWPIGAIFRRGETLRLKISGEDLHNFSSGAPEVGHAANNRGVLRITSSVERPSYLTLPVRPLRDSRSIGKG